MGLSYAAVIATVRRDRSVWDRFPRPSNEALAINYDSTDSTAFAETDQTVTMGSVGDDTGPAEEA